MRHSLQQGQRNSGILFRDPGDKGEAESIHSRVSSHRKGLGEPAGRRLPQAHHHRYQEPVSASSTQTTASTIRPRHHTANIRVGKAASTERELG
jgi:hypothetical protein